MPRRPRLKIKNPSYTLPGREKDTKFMKSIKHHLKQANEAKNLQDAKSHIQAVITTIGFHDIKITSKKLIDVFYEIENHDCIINGCCVGVVSCIYEKSIDEKDTMTIDVMPMDED